MKEFKNVLLGELAIGQFAACFVIALLAAIGLVLYRAIDKAEKAKGTPVTFNWSFFWRDNFPKWMLQVLTIGFMVRMSTALLAPEAVFATAFGIGLASGQFSIWTQGRRDRVRD